MKILRKWVAVLLVVLALVPVLSMPALADDEADISFYEMASVASAYLSDELAKKGASGAEIKELNSCSAGGLLGYSDSIDESGFISKWLMSSLSTSSATLSYESLYDIEMSGGYDGGFYAYAKYGQILKQVGFDNTGTESSGIFRKVSGYIMLGLYSTVKVVPSIMNGVIKLLQFMNPFKLIDTHVEIDGLEYSAPGGIGDGFLAPFARVLGRIYDVCIDHIGFIVFVILFAFLITHLLLDNVSTFNGKENMRRLKQFCIRGVAIFIGVPLCASLYTQCLGMLGGMTDVENLAVGRIIASTFVDFEGWAREFHLAAPSRAGYGSNSVRFVFSDKKTNSVNASTYVNLQTSCYNINRAVWNKAYGMDASHITPVGARDDAAAGAKATEALADRTAALYSSGDDNDSSRAVEDLLERYARGDFYYAGSFETDVRSTMVLGDRDGRQRFDSGLRHEGVFQAEHVSERSRGKGLSRQRRRQLFMGRERHDIQREQRVRFRGRRFQFGRCDVCDGHV